MKWVGHCQDGTGAGANSIVIYSEGVGGFVWHFELEAHQQQVYFARYAWGAGFGGAFDSSEAEGIRRAIGYPCPSP